MFVRSDSSELAVITISFGSFSSCVVSFTVSLKFILIVETPFFDGMSISTIEEVSLAGDVPLVYPLLEMLLLDEESLAGTTSTFKLCPWLKEWLFDTPSCSPFPKKGLLVTFDGADSSITCALVPP